MRTQSIEQLTATANRIRLEALRAIHTVGSGHPGGCLSAADILSVLYFHALRIDPHNPKWEDRDRLLLSKGHAVPAQFAALAMHGYFSLSEMKRLRLHDGMLQGNPNLNIPGCDTVAGSLGQNLSIGVGMALAGKRDKKDYRVFVILGDGELQEGQNWEAAMSASAFRLGNLVGILDHNKVQLCGAVEEILPIGDPGEKFAAFGWDVKHVDGHDIAALAALLGSLPSRGGANGAPTMIVAHTVKGKGISFMEGRAAWHGAAPNEEQMKQIEAELGGAVR